MKYSINWSSIVNDTFNSRFQRQEDLVPADKLQKLMITVVGVGAIGRQLALQLASIGASQVQLIDFDHIEPSNVITQGYKWSDADRRRSKVVATCEAMRELSPDMEIECLLDRYRPRCERGQAIFVCVDSISARAAIWRSAGHGCQFWCDGRMLGEVVRILTVANRETRAHYESTLFDQSQVQRGSCTSQSTIYASSIAAGLMVHQLTRWLRGFEITGDMTLNLLATELAVTNPC
jgi:sulfur carrier protein ThiS adenylyltransferase